MIKYLKVFVKVLIVYIIFFKTYTLKVNHTSWKYEHTYEYTGLVWVVLDHYSIWKYESTDIPKKWLKRSKTPNKRKV